MQRYEKQEETELTDLSQEAQLHRELDLLLLVKIIIILPQSGLNCLYFNIGDTYILNKKANNPPPPWIQLMHIL